MVLSPESRPADSNRRPTHYECVALPAELERLFAANANLQKPLIMQNNFRKKLSEATAEYPEQKNTQMYTCESAEKFHFSEENAVKITSGQIFGNKQALFLG